jgi:hypothetical protein
MAGLRALGWLGVIAMLVGFAWLPAQAAGDGLTRIRISDFREAYAKNGALPTGFKSVYVAPVGIVPGDADLDKLSVRDRKDMQDFLGDQLKQRLGRKFALVERADQGVLVVEAAFTKLRSNRLTIDQSRDRPELDPGRTTGVGAAAVVITLRDGGSGEVLATLSDEQSGWPIGSNTHLHTIWGDAEAASRVWASSLADSL